MGPAAKPEIEIELLIYLGDPDEGASMLGTQALLGAIDQHRAKLPANDALYGAMSFTRGKTRLVPLTPDPAIKLLTAIVRTLPYVIDGEPESVLYTESAHGYLFEPTGDKIQTSFFRGIDPFEPDEFLSEGHMVPAEEFGAQVVGAAERLLEILKRVDPKRAGDELASDLAELLEVGRDAVKNYTLAKEHGLRP